MLLDNALIIFIKYPQPGLVKTRLAKEIGKNEAAFLYRLFVETILSRTTDISFSRIVFYSPAAKREAIRRWLGAGLDNEIYPQKGRDLGERLANAFEFTFRKGAKKVLAIGSDSPTIDKFIILRAFKELENKSCVIGPAFDGGYYLLGLSSLYRQIFQDIDWGSHKVLEETLHLLNKLKLEYALLDEHFDIDRLEDLIRLQETIKKVDRNNFGGLTTIHEAITKLAY